MSNESSNDNIQEVNHKNHQENIKVNKKLSPSKGVDNEEIIKQAKDLKHLKRNEYNSHRSSAQHSQKSSLQGSVKNPITHSREEFDSSENDIKDNANDRREAVKLRDQEKHQNAVDAVRKSSPISKRLYPGSNREKVLSDKIVNILTRRNEEVESFEKVFETYDKTKDVEAKKLLTEGSKGGSGSVEKKLRLNTHHRDRFSENKFEKHNVQNMFYNLNNEYSHIKVVNSGSFMQRMTFDNFKRQTKEKRVKKMYEKNKAKIAESVKLQSFNRLIEDANRRIDAKERLEAMKAKISQQKSQIEKKFTKEEFSEVYQKR